MSDHSTPHAIHARLTAVENDLATRMNNYESAASDRARLTRDWEKRLAICQTRAQGPNADSRKAKALVAAIEQDDLYDRLKDAEGRYEALRVVTRVLEARSTIGMSVLRSQGRA